MRRLRLALGVALAFLAGWWAYAALSARESAAALVASFERTLTAPVRPPRADGRLWPEEWCACGHDGAEHDPDLGCTGIRVVDAYDPLGVAPCGCRRRRCPCPVDPGWWNDPTPPGDSR